MKTFTEYLESNWDYEGILDDDMPDAFEAWILNLDIDTLIDYADAYGDYCSKNK